MGTTLSPSVGIWSSGASPSTVCSHSQGLVATRLCIATDNLGTHGARKAGLWGRSLTERP